MKIKVPGDKSISQRALILSSLARGESRIRGLVPGGDPASTGRAMEALGVAIPAPDLWRGEIRVPGRGLGGLRSSSAPLDLENSGTGARLLLGVLSGHPFEAVVTGDDSLRTRPMARVTDPLSAMGAKFEFPEVHGCLPVRVFGGALRSLEYRLPVASAQVKSALLLAGLVGGARVILWEPGRSRDHTERMMRAVGAHVSSGPSGDGWGVQLLDPPREISPLDIDVPGDFSSAAFFLVLGLLAGGPEALVIEGVGLNETRTGLLPILRRMGGAVDVENLRGEGQGEPMGDLVVRTSDLVGAEVDGSEIPGLIDEVPVLAVAAARARGVTRITGAGELRVKETDRIRALVENLRSLGVEVEELPDGLAVRGTQKALSGRVRSFGDHRIAMAFGILGSLPANEISVGEAEVAGVSFPGFWELLAHVRMEAEGRSGGTARGGGVSRPPVITLDGPAGSGKSTTAREVARRLGFRHLDSGALYRALTFALLAAGVPEEEWSSLSAKELDGFPIRLVTSAEGLRVLLGERALQEELRTEEVTSRVSPLSAIAAVRQWLLGAQRRAARGGGLVADGRDMGTVVFPDAEVKIFLTADLGERARRRFLEREGRGPDKEELATEIDQIQARDARDSGRDLAPLRKPPEALEVDTSNLTFEDQVEIILKHVRSLTGQ